MTTKRCKCITKVCKYKKDAKTAFGETKQPQQEMDKMFVERHKLSSSVISRVLFCFYLQAIGGILHAGGLDSIVS